MHIYIAYMAHMAYNYNYSSWLVVSNMIYFPFKHRNGMMIPMAGYIRGYMEAMNRRYAASPQ